MLEILAAQLSGLSGFSDWESTGNKFKNGGDMTCVTLTENSVSYSRIGSFDAKPVGPAAPGKTTKKRKR